ncbi:MAG: hypothetical protein WBB45_19720 [Cyclobacteriaceae bacterium]
MKTIKLNGILAIMLMVCFSACQDDLSEVESAVNSLDNTESTVVNCHLDNDIGCDEAPADVVYFIENCTSYPKTATSYNVTNTYNIDMNFYVDSDDDINLDQYEAELQAHVNAVVSESSLPIYDIQANIVSWPCRSRQLNLATIRYTVRRCNACTGPSYPVKPVIY